jgi:selenocysteine lyase/cysteine desulfurase
MSSRAARRVASFDRTAIADLLTQGGDERICLDPRTGRNRYGSGVVPEGWIADFASTTASTASAAALHHVETYFANLAPERDARTAYRHAAHETRRDLARLCGLPPGAAARVILASSGTDLHLIAADLARGDSVGPLAVAMADPSETGRGVPFAVRSQRFAVETAHGVSAEIGTLLPGAVAGETAAIRLREPDGRPRASDEVDADFEHACRRSLAAGRRTLLILTDVSKTGLIAPGPACALDLKRRYGEQLTVLVDACQFRLSGSALAAYLDAGFIVAVTGSKFLAGPPFSGALLVPESSATTLRSQSLLPALSNFSGREDWPPEFIGRAVLADLPNFGMLARWRAALFELEAFRDHPSEAITGFLSRFAAGVEAALDGAGSLERLELPPLRRLRDGGWDQIPTIFTFRVTKDRRAMDTAGLQALNERLRRTSSDLGRAVHLGQPVTVGLEDGQPLAALRLSASAPLIVEALTAHDGGKAVIARAVEALEITARAARLG